MRQLSALDRRALLKALSLAPVHAVRVPPAVEAELREAGLISSQVGLVQAAEPATTHTPALLREDLAEGLAEALPGLPMDLRLQVVTDDGAPLPGSRVDVWHHGDGQDLSGRQVADAMGRVRFRTIVPTADASGAVIHLRVTLMSGEVASATLALDAPLGRERHAVQDSQDPAEAQMPLTEPQIPVSASMTAPEGGMEVALVIAITRQGDAADQIDRILRRA